MADCSKRDCEAPCSIICGVVRFWKWLFIQLAGGYCSDGVKKIISQEAVETDKPVPWHKQTSLYRDTDRQSCTVTQTDKPVPWHRQTILSMTQTDKPVPWHRQTILYHDQTDKPVPWHKQISLYRDTDKPVPWHKPYRTSLYCNCSVLIAFRFLSLHFHF